MSQPETIAVILVAAGRGSRAGEGVPKQYRPLRGRPLLAHAIEAFAAVPEVGDILCVIHPDDIELFRAALASVRDAFQQPHARYAFGAATRQRSAHAGLRALANGTAPAPD